MDSCFKKTQKPDGARTDRQRNRASSDQPATNFEELLSDLSAAFVRVSVDQIDNEIERWLQRIVLAMGIDRSIVVQLDPQSRILYVTHLWAREGVSTPPLRNVPIDGPPDTPWLNHKVRSGQVVVISRLDDLPREASTDRESLRQLGNKSNVTIPL